MSAQFEAEIRNSIQSLNGAVARLSAETERANTSMRNLGTSASAASAGAVNVGRSGAASMAGLAQGATRAGGSMAGAFRMAGAALGGLHPVSMIVGAGIGYITGKVFDLIGSIQRAREEAERLSAAVDAAPGERRTKDKAVSMKADIKSLRDKNTEVSSTGLNDAQQAKQRQMIDAGASEDDVVAEMNNMMPNDMFGKRQITAEADASVRHSWRRNFSNDKLRAINGADRQQGAAEFDASKREMDALMRDNGVNVPGARSRASELIEASPAVKAELDKLTKSLNDATEAVKKNKAEGGWSMSWGGSTSAERDVESAKKQRDEFMSQVERRASKDY